jgi:hypothetical protein
MAETPYVFAQQIANRVLEDMQEEVREINECWLEAERERLEMQAKLTTTRADTLKEVLEWLETHSPDDRYPFFYHINYIKALLNQKP